MHNRTSAESLHEACYQGDVETVRGFLASGADPNAPAEPSAREWVSCAGSPRPLNCVATAWAMTDAHVEIARLLIEHGAIVDDTVLDDHSAEMTLGEHDVALQQLFLAARRPRTRDDH